MSLTDDVVKIFKKKFIKVAKKMPVSVEFNLLPDRVDIYVKGIADGSYKWESILEDLACNKDKSIEDSVKDFIYDIRYDLAKKGYFPFVEYRKYEYAPIPSEEAMKKLLTSPDDLRDEDMFSNQLHTLKRFIVLEIDPSRSTITLMGEDEQVCRYRHPLTALFKMKVQGAGMTPEELGYMLFHHAKKLKCDGSHKNMELDDQGCKDEA